jgi:hypothetical protein
MVSKHENEIVNYYSNILTKRIKKGRRIYFVLNIVAVLFLCLLSLGIVLCNFEFLALDFLDNTTLFIFFFIAYEVGIFSFRFSQDGYVLPYQLLLFPEKQSDIYIQLFFSILCDVKLLLFVIPILIYFAGICELSIIMGIGFLFTAVLLYVLLELVLYNFFLIFSDISLKKKESFSAIFFLFLFIYNYLFFTKRLDLLSEFPILGWFGKSIIYLENNNFFGFTLYFILFSAMIFLNFILGKKIFRIKLVK